MPARQRLIAPWQRNTSGSPDPPADPPVEPEQSGIDPQHPRLPADPAVSYPVCTGGRRAAPPAEDIGGVWGLNEIVSVIACPRTT
ncbi:MAG TPA: hypothetical protein VFO01_10145 [Trebonia sp.]|nr:hypothetical protein [Trebonia sp.]